MNIELLEKKLTVVENFPKSGVNFLDMSPVLGEPAAFSYMIDEMCKPYAQEKIDKIIAIEARGFILGSAMASKLNAGMVMVRKRGKLPGNTLKVTYDLEYGSDQIEILADIVKPGERVLIVDDVLATGGTALATYQLCEKIQAHVVGFAFFIEIVFLDGRQRLPKDVYSVLKK